MTTMSPTSIILDIETLSRRPDAVITEIGAIAFDRESFAEVDFIVSSPNIFDQLAAGRHFCAETYEWRRKKETLPTGFGFSTPKETVHVLRDFIQRMRPERIWMQGPQFDETILETLFASLGEELPWEYWRTADTRTSWNLAFPGVKHAPRPHHSLPDCRATLADLHKSLQAIDRLSAA